MTITMNVDEKEMALFTYLYDFVKMQSLKIDSKVG